MYCGEPRCPPTPEAYCDPGATSGTGGIFSGDARGHQFTPFLVRRFDSFILHADQSFNHFGRIETMIVLFVLSLLLIVPMLLTTKPEKEKSKALLTKAQLCQWQRFNSDFTKDYDRSCD